MSSPLPPRPGRPRSLANDRAVLDSAFELLLDGGIEAVKVETVAKRAGVTRATVYRRYKRREDLVIAAIEEGHRVHLERPVIDNPSVEDMVESIAVALSDLSARRLLRRMLTVPHDHPDFFAEFREAAGTRARDEAIRGMLQDAADMGRFPAGADVETVHLLFMSSVTAHLLMRPDDSSAEQIAAYLYQVLRTLGYRKEVR